MTGDQRARLGEGAGSMAWNRLISLDLRAESAHNWREVLSVWAWPANFAGGAIKKPPVATLVLIALACLLPSALSNHNQLNAGTTGSPPPYCNPCLFYGGDFDANGPYPNALLNQDAIDNGQAAVYVPFAVPPNQTWTVAGLFSNNMSTASIIDPPQVQWSISTGVSQGNPGTVIASGTTKASFIE